MLSLGIEKDSEEREEDGHCIDITCSKRTDILRSTWNLPDTLIFKGYDFDAKTFLKISTANKKN